VQILSSAQQKLRGVVRAKLEGAALAGEHATVLRYTRLYPPLGLEEEGVHWFTHYLQQLIRSRAKEDYNSLVDGAHPYFLLCLWGTRRKRKEHICFLAVCN
jgi:conserved oligomeric Golgi complex subunit 4